MGKIVVVPDNKNPEIYSIMIENEDGCRIVFGCNDRQFDEMIEKLKQQRYIAKMERERNFDMEKWK